MVPFACPCGAFYHVADESQGHQVRCPFCYELRDVPAPPPKPVSPRIRLRLRGSWRNALSLAALALAIPIGGPTLIWIATLTQRTQASSPTQIVHQEESWEEAQEEPKHKIDQKAGDIHPVNPRSSEPREEPQPQPSNPPRPDIAAEAIASFPTSAREPVRPNLAPGAYGVLRSPLYDSVTICPRWQTYSELFMESFRLRKRDACLIPCNNRFNKVPNGTPVKILARETIELPLVVPLQNIHLSERPRPHNLFRIMITGGPHQHAVGYVPVEHIDPESISDQPLEYRPEHPKTIHKPQAKACPPIFPPWFLEEVMPSSASRWGRR